jgi:nucleotide-binding universal stress UspA family protein
MRLHPPKTVIVPVDFSEASLAGLEAAKLLVKRWHARLELVHVNENTPAYLTQNVDTDEERAELEQYYLDLEIHLRDLAKDCPEVEARVIDGFAKEVIGELAEDAVESWIVMGTHGHGGLRHFMLGSKAESALYGSTVPILTVHSAPKSPWPKRILVPVKFCSYADKALTAALDLARDAGARVSVLHVAEDDETAEDPDVLREHVHLLAEKHGIDDFDWMLERGDPSEAIIRSAGTERFDLVVLAAHRKVFYGGLFIGMTASRILRHCPAPVLSTPVSVTAQKEKDYLARGIRKADKRHAHGGL